MKDLTSSALGFITVAIIIMLGGGIVAMTNSTVATATNNATLVDSLNTDVGTALTTFTTMLPILALAVVGGLALMYVLGFFSPRR